MHSESTRRRERAQTETTYERAGPNASYWRLISARGPGADGLSTVSAVPWEVRPGAERPGSTARRQVWAGLRFVRITVSLRTICRTTLAANYMRRTVYRPLQN